MSAKLKARIRQELAETPLMFDKDFSTPELAEFVLRVGSATAPAAPKARHSSS